TVATPSSVSKGKKIVSFGASADSARPTEWKPPGRTQGNSSSISAGAQTPAETSHASTALSGGTGRTAGSSDTSARSSVKPAETPLIDRLRALSRGTITRPNPEWAADLVKVTIGGTPAHDAQTTRYEERLAVVSAVGETDPFAMD